MIRLGRRAHPCLDVECRATECGLQKERGAAGHRLDTIGVHGATASRPCETLRFGLRLRCLPDGGEVLGVVQRAVHDLAGEQLVDPSTDDRPLRIGELVVEPLQGAQRVGAERRQRLVLEEGNGSGEIVTEQRRELAERQREFVDITVDHVGVQGVVADGLDLGLCRVGRRRRRRRFGRRGGG